MCAVWHHPNYGITECADVQRKTSADQVGKSPRLKPSRSGFPCSRICDRKTPPMLSGDFLCIQFSCFPTSVGQADFKHISSTFPSRLDAQPSTFQADSRCNANRLKAPMSGALILPYEISTAPGFVRQIGDFRPSRVNTLRLFPNP